MFYGVRNGRVGHAQLAIAYVKIRSGTKWVQAKLLVSMR
jgi:hypothetical protein